MIIFGRYDLKEEVVLATRASFLSENSNVQSLCRLHECCYQTLLALDQVAMVSMKTQIMPKPIIEKIVNLLRDFGQKKNLERHGKYMMKRVRSRTSAEASCSVVQSCIPSESK